VVHIAAVWEQFLFVRDSRLGWLDSSAGGVFELFQSSLSFHHDLGDVSMKDRFFKVGVIVTFVSPVSMFNASREYADSGIQKKIMMSARAKAPPMACRAIR
jgi:hypothetical protein